MFGSDEVPATEHHHEGGVVEPSHRAKRPQADGAHVGVEWHHQGNDVHVLHCHDGPQGQPEGYSNEAVRDADPKIAGPAHSGHPEI